MRNPLESFLRLSTLVFYEGTRGPLRDGNRSATLFGNRGSEQGFFRSEQLNFFSELVHTGGVMIAATSDNQLVLDGRIF